MKSFGKYLILVIALLGFVFSIFMIYQSSKRTKAASIPFQPPSPPYMHYVAGEGIVEASSNNISIGTPFQEIVEAVYVIEGDIVKKDAPLFKLNTQDLEAELAVNIKEKEVQEKYLDNALKQFSFYQNLKDKRAVSQSDYYQSCYNVQIAQKTLEQLIAKINLTKTYIDRSTIRAPFDGEVLDVAIHVGESAQINPYHATYLILFGKIDECQIRINIDETDIWRIYKNAKATAYVRGNSSIKFPVDFLRIEPYVVPKVSLTDNSTEKVDVRVLQLLYKFKRENLPVYAGQLLDVYIEAKPSDMNYNEKENYYN